MAVHRMSESVYVGMCQNVGVPQEVAFRRDVMDINQAIYQKRKGNWFKSMISGSLREGFRLNRGLDIDTMYWSDNDRVVWDFSQSKFYNMHRQTIILCDSSESLPGYTLLWLPFGVGSLIVLLACIRMNGGLYISSSKYREITSTFHLISPDSSQHGPCSSGIINGLLEYDNAHCVFCEFWPPCASTWIERCNSWPPSHVVNDIVRSGCHFVAIGHKLGNHADKEWRISFSQAESKLVYSMNHTQFLIYGLMKLFLKEVINNGLRDEDKLLCSYHMKTAVFWTIQRNTLPHWSPKNLLEGFWVCFKLLLEWVYNGVCPNFFIPQNNMFLANIHGQAQSNLFMQLYGYYEKGIAMLLNSFSIRSSIIDVLCNPRLTVCTEENTLISEADFDIEFFHEIYKNDLSNSPKIQSALHVMHIIEQLIGLPLTQYQVIMLQKCTSTYLKGSAFMLYNMYKSIGVNKKIYIADKISCHMLKLAAKFGFVSDILYIAMYYYKTLRYRDALSVIEMTKVKLAQPYLMYMRLVDRERYTEAVGGQPWSTKMQQGVAEDIKFYNDLCFIDELIPEQQSSQQNNMPLFLMPPVVLLQFLEFLCYRHIDTTLSQAALDELQFLVHHDWGLYISRDTRDISWEILGICQQITGNLQAALYSYQQSLITQYPFNRIRTATRERIHDLQF